MNAEHLNKAEKGGSRREGGEGRAEGRAGEHRPVMGTVGDAEQGVEGAREGDEWVVKVVDLEDVDSHDSVDGDDDDEEQEGVANEPD